MAGRRDLGKNYTRDGRKSPARKSPIPEPYNRMAARTGIAPGDNTAHKLGNNSYAAPGCRTCHKAALVKHAHGSRRPVRDLRPTPGSVGKGLRSEERRVGKEC